MKVTNNSNKVITLINGKKSEKYSSVNIDNPNNQLMVQIEHLVKMGLIRAEY